MPKLDIDDLKPILNRVDVQPPEKAEEIMREAKKLLKQEAEDRAANKKPREKQQYVILISDPDKLIPAGTEVVGWVTQIKEEHDAGTIVDRILKAIRNFNLSKKGKKSPAKTIGDGIDTATRKFFKTEEIKIATKMPVRVIFTDNKLPDVPLAQPI